MRSFVMICLWGFVLGSMVVGTAYGAPRETAGWALVIGIDRYDSSDVAPLQCPRDDARAMAQALIKACGFRADHVILMTSDAADAREKPTSANILRWLYGLRACIKPGDTFVFYFAGHGMVFEGESYLLTAESSLGGAALVKKSSLGVKELHDALKDVRAARVLQLVDACRNDPQAGRSTGDNKMGKTFSRDLALVPKTAAGRPNADVVATVFACKVGQRSYENCDGHGYFTYFVLQGLYGSAADAEGKVSLTSLLSYLEQKVPEAVRLREQGRVQEPWAEIQGTGGQDWLLAQATPGGDRVSTPTEVDPTQPTVLIKAPASGWKTPSATAQVPVVIGGGRPQSLTVTVNGQAVAIAPNAVAYTADGASVTLAVPLAMGQNSVVVTTVSASGIPAQSACLILRDAAAAAPVAASPLPVVPASGRVTAPKSAAIFYTGNLTREHSEYDKFREKWGQEATDMLRPSTSSPRE